MLNDSVALATPKTYFANDSVKLFKNTDLTQEAGKIPFYSVVYPYQISEDKGCTLVADKPQLDADSIGHAVIGWIDDITSLPDSTLVFKDRERKDTLPLLSNDLNRKLQLSASQPAIRYSPVLSYRNNDTSFCFKTRLPMPVIDKRESYVLNREGPAKNKPHVCPGRKREHHPTVSSRGECHPGTAIATGE